MKRLILIWALGLVVSTRRACHNRSSVYEADFSARVDRLQAAVERGRITIEGEDFSAVLDSLIWCKFLRKACHDLRAYRWLADDSGGLAAGRGTHQQSEETL